MIKENHDAQGNIYVKKSQESLNTKGKGSGIEEGSAVLLAVI